jgi:hypothetical protein
MFQRLGFIASCFALALLLTGPSAYADMMPTSDEETAPEVVVTAALVETGLTAEDASDIASQLTADELAILSENPVMVQNVGALTYWWEGVWGALWLGGALGLTVALLDDAN